ncbi:hypothetical protein [Pseudoalteromonas aurantia]|uniref:Bacteriocin n=1 Tax=Pseudoalteromonas aurantia 208 TaxID=1314867 RepID=A0ABR9EC39_9GAMM|nr:hypothetical protein [Pseudoalteromonas aurantia]MBE0368548.1 hypothetical protein [Pseudoalteromonas aurantia 208]
MNLKLKKNKIKNLSNNTVIEKNATPMIAGGRGSEIYVCFSNIQHCGASRHPNACQPSQHVTVCT